MSNYRQKKKKWQKIKPEEEKILRKNHIDEKVISVSTNLLGKVNVDNIVLASALAYLLGVNLLDIKKGISELKSVPHRMELIKGFANVIDDSYNSNIVGFKEALKTIASFEGDKILVTPGMVELGDKQYEMNFKIGQEIPKLCDYVIIMNKTKIHDFSKKKKYQNLFR